MINTDEELEATLKRIANVSAQLKHLQATQTGENLVSSASGLIAEIATMQSEVRAYIGEDVERLRSLDWALTIAA